MRSIAALAFTLAVVEPGMAAETASVMGQSNACGSKPDYVCINSLKSQKVETINKLELNFPANGAVSITLMASVECTPVSFGNPIRIAAQITRDKDARPENTGGAVSFKDTGIAYSTPISLTSYFPVKKGTSAFFGRIERFGGGTEPCKVTNGTVGYTFIPD